MSPCKRDRSSLGNGEAVPIRSKRQEVIRCEVAGERLLLGFLSLFLVPIRRITCSRFSSTGRSQTRKASAQEKTQQDCPRLTQKKDGRDKPCDLEVARLPLFVTIFPWLYRSSSPAHHARKPHSLLSLGCGASRTQMLAS